MIACSFTAAGLLLAPPQAPDGLPADPAAALAAAIDLPTRAERDAAALALSRRDVALDDCLAAARALRPRSTPVAGDRIERIDGRTIRYRTRLELMGAQRDAEILVRTPAGLDTDVPQPLLLVRHEAGGSGATALATWAPLADRCGLLLAAPTETYELYRKDGWAYMPDAQQGVLAALRFVRRHHDVDEDRVFLGGVGGGGHMTWDVGLRFADRFAALLPVNGSPRLGNAQNECNTIFLDGLAATPVRAIRFGPQDPRIDEHVDRALRVLRTLGNDRADRRDAADATAAIGASMVPAEWFAQRRERPDRVVKVPELCWAPRHPDHGRAHWIEIRRVDPKVQLPFPPPLPAGKLRGRDAAGQRDLLEQVLREQQPRLEVRMLGAGRFEVLDRHVHSFRLLLTGAMCGPDGKVEVRWRGQVLRRQVAPDRAVLLREFVERFDRSFLPTLEVVLP